MHILKVQDLYSWLFISGKSANELAKVNVFAPLFNTFVIDPFIMCMTDPLWKYLQNTLIPKP